MGARGYLLWNPLGDLHAGRSRARVSSLLRLRTAWRSATSMRTRVVTVNADDSARLAVLRMLEEGVGSVAVLRRRASSSASSPSGTCSALAGEGTDLDAVRIGDVMTREPVTVDAGVAVLDAARLMGERKIRHLPVVEGEHLLGMVGIRDVLGSLVERALADARRRRARHGPLALPDAGYGASRRASSPRRRARSGCGRAGGRRRAARTRSRRDEPVAAPVRRQRHVVAGEALRLRRRRAARAPPGSRAAGSAATPTPRAGCRAGACRKYASDSLVRRRARPCPRRRTCRPSGCQ